MIKSAIKHFGIVGIGFAFVLGWVLTLVVNGAVGTLLQSIFGVPPTQFYLGSLSLTIVSLSLILAATILGNRLYRSWFGGGSLPVRALFVSTTLFAVLVLWRVMPELGSVMDTVSAQTSYFYNHSWALVGILSLPLLRLFCIPLAYFLVGRQVKCAVRSQGAPLMWGGA